MELYGNSIVIPKTFSKEFIIEFAIVIFPNLADANAHDRGEGDCKLRD